MTHKDTHGAACTCHSCAPAATDNPMARLTTATLRSFVRMEGAFGRGARARAELVRREAR